MKRGKSLHLTLTHIYHNYSESWALLSKIIAVGKDIKTRNIPHPNTGMKFSKNHHPVLLMSRNLLIDMDMTGRMSERIYTLNIHPNMSAKMGLIIG